MGDGSSQALCVVGMSGVMEMKLQMFISVVLIVLQMVIRKGFGGNEGRS